MGHCILALQFILSTVAGVPTPQPTPARPRTLAKAPTPPKKTKKEDEDTLELTDVTEEKSSNLARVERTINLYGARTVPKYHFMFTIDHRPRTTLFSKRVFEDFFGYDSGGLKIGIGLRFGILDYLDVGILRLNNTVEIFDVYEFDVRYAPLNQKKHYINMALRAGLTWFVQPGMKDAVGGFGQLLIDYKLSRWALFGAGFLFHSNSSNANKTDADKDYSGAVQAVVEFFPLRWLSLNFEISTPVFGYRAKHPAMAFAVKFITHRHTFSLVFSNFQYISADGVVAGSNRNVKNLIFGFTITRYLKFF